ncbi:hypothetical protein ACKC9G_00370 [Pokkaliibacter sp. CJK22405]|uniref:hypothetical protein n=1 Tax=Pokkaliibacter sp. CJK22405 TaxID=3384615 RepID=UPI00398481D8
MTTSFPVQSLRIGSGRYKEKLYIVIAPRTLSQLYIAVEGLPLMTSDSLSFDSKEEALDFAKHIVEELVDESELEALVA